MGFVANKEHCEMFKKIECDGCPYRWTNFCPEIQEVVDKREKENKLKKRLNKWKEDSNKYRDLLRWNFGEKEEAEFLGYLASTVIIRVKNVPNVEEWHNKWFKDLTGRNPEDYLGYSIRTNKTSYDTFSYEASIIFIPPKFVSDVDELKLLIPEINDNHIIYETKKYIKLHNNKFYRMLIEMGFTVENDFGEEHDVEQIKYCISENYHKDFNQGYKEGAKEVSL